MERVSKENYYLDIAETVIGDVQVVVQIGRAHV